MSDHKFERVAWHLLGEYGPVCRWCGKTEDEHTPIVDTPKENHERPNDDQ